MRLTISLPSPCPHAADSALALQQYLEESGLTSHERPFAQALLAYLIKQHPDATMEAIAARLHCLCDVQLPAIGTSACLPLPRTIAAIAQEDVWAYLEAFCAARVVLGGDGSKEDEPAAASETAHPPAPVQAEPAEPAPPVVPAVGVYRNMCRDVAPHVLMREYRRSCAP